MSVKRTRKFKRDMEPNRRPSPAYERQLVGWVNRMRRKIEPRMRYIARLPKGEPQDGANCPLARAISTGITGEALVDGDKVLFYGEAGSERLVLSGKTPQYVSRFLDHFDAGDFPGLELGE